MLLVRLLHKAGIAKTHRGVKNQFHKLAKEDPRIDRSLAADLAATYHIKEAADYETGQEGAIGPEDASDAICAAERFVEAIKDVLSDMPGTGEGEKQSAHLPPGNTVEKEATPELRLRTGANRLR